MRIFVYIINCEGFIKKSDLINSFVYNMQVWEIILRKYFSIHV